ncbi:MAG: putative permease [Methanocella sp. PtaU1.Bin125]|nr:MAG: putative permease [Methanocella sp. PtaU1.Bin125]
MIMALMKKMTYSIPCRAWHMNVYALLPVGRAVFPASSGAIKSKKYAAIWLYLSPVLLFLRAVLPNDMLKEPVDYFVYNVLGMSPGTRLGEAVNFFVYDTIKIFLLLAVLIFAISFIRSFFPPERVRGFLTRKNEYIGNVLAALVGIITPFCSCSAVPLFIGFVESGIPLGVTFSFLIASPTINEVAVILLLGLFGWKITALYIGSGLAIAIAAGIVIGRLKLESEVEDYVYDVLNRKKAAIPCACGETMAIEQPAMKERIAYAYSYMAELLKKLFPYVVVAIAIGAFIHGYAPEGLLAEYAGKDNPVAVPIAVLIGVPLYSNAAGILPVVAALMEKGVPVGTALAFMMAVTALSFPEMIILRKVLKPKLLAIYIAILTVAIIFIGYLFNLAT